MKEASTITGNVETTQAGSTINIQQSSVQGSVLSGDSQSVTITDTSVNGKVEVTNSQTVSITGNTINGDLTINGTTGPCTGDDTNNAVSGNTDPCP